MKAAPFFKTTESRQTLINHTPLNYYEAGSGTPMILLHGWPQTPHIWRKIWNTLTAQYHVYALELPGMGNTHALASADTQTVAAFVKAFCEQQGIPNFHLVAHDIGSWVAVTFALAYEGMLKSLTILDAGIPGLVPDSVFSPLNAQKIWQFYFHAIDEVPEMLIEGKEHQYLSWYFTRKTAIKEAITPEDILLYTQAYTGAEKLKNSFDYYRAFTQSAKQNQTYQHKLSIPVLTIGGEHALGASMGMAMQPITQGRLVSASIPNCGHYIAEEQPEAFLEMLLPFLAESNR